MISQAIGNGYAQYDMINGKIQMVGFQGRPKSRFSALLNMRGAIRNNGFKAEKSTWADGWFLKVPHPDGHPDGRTYDCIVNTLYLDPSGKWSLYQAIPCDQTNNDLDDEKLITKDADHGEICAHLRAIAAKLIKK